MIARMLRLIHLLILITAGPMLLGQTDGNCIPIGGAAGLERLFEQELNYPAVALEAGIKGEVVVTTFLDPSGRTLSVVIGRSLCPECDAEALRVMHQVIWLPATPGEACSGKENYISVPFDPGKYKRWVKGRHERTGKVFDLPVDTSLVVRSAKQLDEQVAPQVPGGLRGLPTYLAHELRYPGEAFRYSLEGVVTLDFVVEPSGCISNMHASQAVGGGCTEEAMRLMYRIAWQPGVMHGHRTRSQMQVSIRFTLPKQGR